MIYRNFIKGLFDFLVSSIAFIVFLPVFLVVLVLLFLVNDGNPFFFQRRPGKNELVFNVIKFKTMNDRRDSKGNLLPDGLRLTALGKFLRKTSLDELPQLINVMKGDMSLVGPRPLLVKYLPLYSEKQKRRHDVKPGITGWAQVNGRNAISWEDKFDFDVWYVDNLSFFLDMKILFLTLLKVVKREGISSEGQATTGSFKGNNGKYSL